MVGPDNLLTGTAFASLFAYGPVPGVELIWYFLGLITWAGFAVAAVFLSPITALLRRWRGRRQPVAEPKQEPVATPGQEGEGQNGTA